MPGFNNNENVCLLCQSRCVGPSGILIHILECWETQQLGIEKWLDVEEVMPLVMKNDVRLYNTRQKLVFIASRFSGIIPWNVKICEGYIYKNLWLWWMMPVKRGMQLIK